MISYKKKESGEGVKVADFNKTDEAEAFNARMNTQMLLARQWK